MSYTPLPVGKLDAEQLRRLLGGIECRDRSVILGPGIGRDVAVIDNGAEGYLLAKSDPITFATDAIGYYVVNVNANDIATSGGRARWLLATALLPENTTTEAMVAEIFGQITTACEDLGVTLVGGHTEITYGLDRPIVIGQMLGEVARGDLITPEGLQVGDAIIATKAVPLEGTALIAREKRDELLAAGLAPETLTACAEMLYTPGISVVADARVAVSAGEVHAMHDPTEGGLATGLWELAEAAGVGLEIDADAIPVLDEGRAICGHYGLDPLGLIASGSLLIGCAAGHAEGVVAALGEQGILAAVIGHTTPAEAGVRLLRAGVLGPMPRYDQDELTKVL